MILPTKHINGDIWLSRQTLKNILNMDLAKILSKRTRGQTLTAESYIEQLIQRLDEMRPQRRRHGNGC
jgi:exosome complex RNA-binding protein Rrp4